MNLSNIDQTPALPMDNLTSDNSTEVSQCTSCGKPLGQESKDLGYILCHDCRVCSKCSLPVSPQEIAYCNSHSIIVTHARCLIHSERNSGNVEVNQSRLDRNNLARLTITPNLELSVQSNQHAAVLSNRKFIHEMNFEEIYVQLQMFQALAADCSLMLKQDKGKTASEIKKDLEKRESEKFKRAEQEARTSSRPTGKSPESVDEVRLAWYCEKFGVKDRKIAMKNMKLRDKAIESMMKTLGISEEKAIKIVDSE